MKTLKLYKRSIETSTKVKVIRFELIEVFK